MIFVSAISLILGGDFFNTLSNSLFEVIYSAFIIHTFLKKTTLLNFSRGDRFKDFGGCSIKKWREAFEASRQPWLVMSIHN
jgi:hypothetical protein